MSTYSVNDATSFESVMREISAKLDIMVDEITADVSRAISDVALNCLELSVPKAPIESGDLRSSGYAKINGLPFAEGTESGGARVVGIMVPSDDVTIEVGYSSPYAHRQHEDLSLAHDRTDGYRRSDGSTVNMVAGGEAKFLESVIVENIDKWGNHIRSAASKAIKGE
jgi:hypothetical protein